ncbi:MAG: virulence protein RhuM/Fic/DOC family protein [Candidatus Gracilibacteria bacterium]|nr:virulence protein RhuM/Fic/DOC family protein [Candidatus Gracilibacteria bacterium]
MNKGEIQIYKDKTGDIDVQVNFNEETVWLDSYQIASIFGKDRTTIQRHIKNIYSSGELNEDSTCAKNAQVQNEGERQVKRDKNLYNLDMILSIGYRTNSEKAMQFRKWVSNILKEYLIKGYSINKKRLEEKGYKELENTLNLFKNTLKSGNLSQDEAIGLLDIITNYTNTWLLLQNYDENNLLESGKTKNLDYKLDSEEALLSLMELKENLINKNEATDLFAKQRENEALKGIFGNIYQTFGGIDLYNSVEEKSANLLYFIVKDHPFYDGNKRSGAFLFILFLAKNHILFDNNGNKKINDRALVAITLLIAESNPKDKEIMVKLLINLIN